MKKYLKTSKIFTCMLLAAFLIAQNFTFINVKAAEPGPTVYVNGQSGSDENAGEKSTPVKTFTKAYQLLAETGGTIAISGQITVENTISLSSKELIIDNTSYKIKEEKSVNIIRASGYGNPLIVNDKSLTLSDITINASGNTSKITINNTYGSTLTINNGTTITNAQSGAISNNGELIMNGGTISDNIAISSGAGVYNDETGTFTMSGGKISGNILKYNYSSADVYGAGVYNKGTFTMTGGKISGNMADTILIQEVLGGGVYNAPSANAIISGGEISENKGTLGGGVYNAGTLTMNNGKVTSNVALGHYVSGKGEWYGEGGGGVYNKVDATFTMKDGTISGNTASKSNGGGILNHGNLKIENGSISQNKSTTGYVNSILSGGEGGGVYNDNTTGFIMNNGNIIENTAYEGGGIFGYGTINGGKISGNTADIQGGGINGTFTINGGTISNNSAKSGGGGYGNITVNGGKISGNTAESTGGGIHSDHTFVMTDGAISNNTANNGGGVYNYTGKFTMSGGEISNNTATTYGGGISNSSVNSVTLEVTNGVIKNNTATITGGGVYHVKGTFTMSGGEISGNTALGEYVNYQKPYGGGGVYNKGTFTLSNGKIVNNTAATHGGGIHNHKDGYFYMTGGEISGNTASYVGEGIYSPGRIYMSENASVNVNNDMGIETIYIPASLNRATQIYGRITPIDSLYTPGTEIVYHKNRVVIRVDYDALGSDVLYEDAENTIKKWQLTPKAGWYLEATDLLNDVNNENRIVLRQKEQYTVTFVDYDDKEISKETYYEGDTVNVPADPARTSDNVKEYTWAFNGWDHEVSAVTGNATYKATYKKVYVDYTVTFVDHDNKKISEKTYHYGDTVNVPEAPKRVSVNVKDYTWKFTGWNPVVNKVTADVTYKATYKKVYVDYKISFVNWDGSEISSETYHYGDLPVAPTQTPTRPADDKYTYTFKEWPTIEPVTENKVYKAIYEAKELPKEVVAEVKGRLTYTDGTPISNAKITLHSEQVKETVSDKNGYYIFKNVTIENHSLTVFKDDGKTELAAVDVFVVGDKNNASGTFEVVQTSNDVSNVETSAEDDLTFIVNIEVKKPVSAPISEPDSDVPQTGDFGYYFWSGMLVVGLLMMGAGGILLVQAKKEEKKKQNKVEEGVS